MKHTLIASFLFISLQLAAQENYLVTAKGETLTGSISFDFDKPNFDKVTIKTDSGKESFMPYQVKLIYYNGDTLKALKLTDKQKFGIPILKGERISKYYIQKESNFEFDGSYLVKSDGTYMELINIGFKKQLSKFLKDCPDLEEKITSGELKKGDMDDIVTQYNACGSPAPKEAATHTPVPIQNGGSESEQIKALLKKEYLSMSIWNYTSHKANVAPNFTLMENSKVWQSDEIQALFEENNRMLQQRANEFEFQCIETIGSLGYAVYQLNTIISDTTQTFTQKWMGVATFKKTDGSWQILSIQTHLMDK